MIFQTLKTSTQDIMEHFQLVGVPFGHGLNTTNEEVVWWPTTTTPEPTTTTPEPTHDYSQDYLTIKAGSNGYTLKYSRNGNSYSLDTSIDSGNTWNTITTSDTVTVNAGQSLMVRGTNLYSDPDAYALNFKITGTCSVEGNVLSLEYGDNFINQTALPNKDSLFRGLFANNTGITSAENLALVATSFTSSWGAYEEMFYGCTGLTTAPELPATTLTEGCYRQMFAGCISLTTAPKLPATTLTNSCYNGMFSDCTNLTTAPELPATTLADGCYWGMFSGCTSLTTTPELPVTTLTQNCYSNMFRRCSNLTTAPELPATELQPFCYQSMFNGCTKLNYVKCMASYGMSGSTLLYWLSGVASKGRFVMSEDATTGTTTGNTQWKIDSGDGIPSGWTFTYDTTYLTFISSEDGNMFKFSGTSASNILQYSLDNGNTWTSLGHNTNSPAVDSGKSITFKGSNMSTTSSNGIGHFISTGQFKAEGNVMSIISGDSFSTQTSLTGKTSAFTALFMDCTGLTTAEKLILPATTLGNKCYASMFSGCTNLTTAPELPATTLVDWCYYGMFSGCSSLNYIKCLACSGMTATNCLTNWVSGVASSGTFVRSVLSTIGATSGDARWASNSVNGIPVNWIRETNSMESPLVFISHASNNTIKFTRSGGTGTSVKTIEVSTDLGKTWTSKTSTAQGVTLATLQSGATLLIRGDNPQYSSGTSSGNVFTSTGEFEAAGNIMSLVGSTNFSKNTELLSAWTFANLFSGCTALTSVDNLVLPAVDLMEGCYYQMFILCSFAKAPELPATTLAASCYRGMFNRCFNLTSPPELPATTLTDQCYRYMFYSCTTLTTAPELPATTLNTNCYYYMFRGCTSLNYVKCLASSGMTSSGCLNEWLYGVASSGTFVRSPNATTGSTAGASQWLINSENGIPSGWTVNVV